jgi:hypothetical protein
MAAARSLAFVVVGLAISGCSSYLPKPEYSYVPTPAPVRALPDGTRVDNRGYHMDAQGYRLDRNGNVLGEVNYEHGESGASNAVAGYYISSTGEVATGTVAVPSEGSRAGAGYGPGTSVRNGGEYSPVTSATSNVPRGSSYSGGVPVPVSTLTPGTETSVSPAATTGPIPLAPPSTN